MVLEISLYMPAWQEALYITRTVSYIANAGITILCAGNMVPTVGCTYFQESYISGACFGAVAADPSGGTIKCSEIKLMLSDYTCMPPTSPLPRYCSQAYPPPWQRWWAQWSCCKRPLCGSPGEVKKWGWGPLAYLWLILDVNCT